MMPMDGDRLEASREEAVDTLANTFVDQAADVGHELPWEVAQVLATTAIDTFIVVARDGTCP